jgi:Fe(3+) dicitrate transport protein
MRAPVTSNAAEALLMRALAFLLLVLLGGAAAARAQSTPSSRLAGSVVASTGEPVAQARLSLERGGRVAHTFAADERGRFTLAGLEPGEYVLRAAGDRYLPSTRHVAVGSTSDVWVEIVLVERVLELAPLTIIGETAALEHVPGSTRIVPRAAIDDRRPMAAHELLRHAGVHVQDEDPLGVNLNIGVRGLNPRRSSRVLLLEDGVPIHLAPYGDPTAHYQPPVATLRRIEVVKGSGQIVHGPQTVGGVINFVRVAPPARPGGSAVLGAGSHGSRTAHVRAGTRFGEDDAHGALLTFDQRAADAARDGWNHRVTDAQLQLRLRMTNRQSLLLRGGWYAENSRFGETGLTQEEFERDPFGNPTPHDTFELRRLAAHAIHVRELASDAGITTVLYAQQIDRTSWRQASSSSDRFGTPRYTERFGCTPAAAGIADCGFQGRPRLYRFAGIEPRLRTPITRGAVPVHVDMGARAHVESVVRQQFLSPGRSVDGGRLDRDNQLITTALSAFAQARAAVGAWHITPGTRIEHVRARNVNRIRNVSMDDAYTRWLPGLGAAYNGAATTFFAGAHRGFAPPRPADVLAPEPGQSIVQVRPEVSWNFELGTRTRALPHVALEATLFRIDFANQIVEGYLAGAGQRFVNAGATLHQGIEIGAQLDVPTARGLQPMLRLDATYLPVARFTSGELSAIDGETPILGNRLPYAPRWLLSGEVGIATRGGFALAIHGEFVAEQFSDDLNTRAPTANGQRGVLPPHTVLGATLNQPLERIGATLFAAVRNLGNAVYITARQEGIIIGMPRRAMLGVEWRF